MKWTGSTGQLFGWDPLTWTIIDQVGILLGYATVAAGVLGVLVTWFKRDSIRRWFRSNRFPAVGGDFTALGPVGGCVFCVSQAELPEWVIEQLTLNRVGLVDTPASAAAGDRIQAFVEARGGLCWRRRIENPNDPECTRVCVSELLEDMVATPGQAIMVDVTGGTKPMSIGAFMAAEEAGVSTIYVTADRSDNRPIDETARIIRVSQPVARK